MSYGMTQVIKDDSNDGEIGSGLQDLPDYSFLRQKDLHALKVIPFSSATLWRMVGSGRFPRPVKLSPQITAWRAYEIKKWSRDPIGWQQ
jgi:predicted DNA-binding transcriptional regulator AlpA|tara:strand:- start:556 stop:822 length:267 start_codon:yes stop_codon:yes gene_type:complete